MYSKNKKLKELKIIKNLKLNIHNTNDCIMYVFCVSLKLNLKIKISLHFISRKLIAVKFYKPVQNYSLAENRVLIGSVVPKYSANRLTISSFIFKI